MGLTVVLFSPKHESEFSLKVFHFKVIIRGVRLVAYLQLMRVVPYRREEESDCSKWRATTLSPYLEQESRSG